MKVKVRMFAGLKELVGASEVVVHLRGWRDRPRPRGAR